MKKIGGSGNGCRFLRVDIESAVNSIDKYSSITVGGIIINGNCCFFYLKGVKTGKNLQNVKEFKTECGCVSKQ